MTLQLVLLAPMQMFFFVSFLVQPKGQTGKIHMPSILAWLCQEFLGGIWHNMACSKLSTSGPQHSWGTMESMHVTGETNPVAAATAGRWSKSWSIKWIDVGGVLPLHGHMRYFWSCFAHCHIQMYGNGWRRAHSSLMFFSKGRKIITVKISNKYPVTVSYTLSESG